MNTANYFINESSSSISSSTAIHYWEPHTSSIDFCETNYIVSNYIVEVHNAFSSLWVFSLLGFIGIAYGNPTKERMFTIVYGILFFIGIGSAALHATLHWIFQSSDELPMIYLVISVVYCILEVDSPSPRGEEGAKTKYKHPRLPYYLLFLCCMNTIIYFSFQQIYIIFLSTFGVMTLLSFSLHVRLGWKHYQKLRSSNTTMTNNSKIALKFYYWHYITFLVIATPIWILDQFRCNKLLPYYNLLPFPLKGCTLHVVWHACAGLAAHTIIQFIIASRLDFLGKECQIKRILGILPVVTIKKTMNTAATTTTAQDDSNKTEKNNNYV